MSYIGKNLIDGSLVDSAAGKWFDAENPATGEVIGKVAFSGESDVDMAVKSAKDAFLSWKMVSAKERGQMMFEVARRLRAHEAELVDLMVQETGKAIRTECRPEVGLFPETFEFFGGLSMELKGETIPFDPGMLTMTIREPLGVVGAILPWNVPLLLMGLKVPPALVAGNTVVVKSAEQSPLVTLRAVEIMNEVLPKGVVNVIHGDGPLTGASLVKHPDVVKVSFTGSVESGKHVAVSSASKLIPSTLELGGKSPMIVCEDADLEAAVEGAVTGMRFTRQGQSCSASSRMFVHEDLHDAFIDKLTNKVKALKIGDPSDEATDIGAIISQEQLDKVKAYVQLGDDSAAEKHVCGEVPSGLGERGFWHAPVVFTGVKNTDRIAQEEIFGPVACVIKWNDFEEVINQANETSFGLAGTIWTKDFSKAMKGVTKLEAGFVQVNQNLVVKPGLSYGGYKNSGLGKEASLESMLEHFTKKKTVIMNLG